MHIGNAIRSVFMFWQSSWISKLNLEQVLSELLIQSKLHHPNIVEFYRSFISGDRRYIVLQLCENNALYQLVESRGYLTEFEVRIYTIQIAGAIKYMHSKCVIHRDLKLGNIFLDAYMNVKIGDFDLAAILTSCEARRSSACGTLDYMAPECFGFPRAKL